LLKIWIEKPIEIETQNYQGFIFDQKTQNKTFIQKGEVFPSFENLEKEGYLYYGQLKGDQKHGTGKI
jgi:hypothetical protein